MEESRPPDQPVPPAARRPVFVRLPALEAARAWAWAWPPAGWNRARRWLTAGRPRRRWIAALVVALALLEIASLLLFFPPALSPLQQGRQFYNSGHYTRAAGALRQELQARPHNSEAQLLLAQSLIALRQWPAAGASLNDLLRASPNDPTLYYWLGRAQLGWGRPEAAETSWQVALALTADHPQPAAARSRAEVALGTLRFRQGRYQEAGQLLYAALGRPANLDALDRQQALYIYGLTLARDLRFEDARQALERAANSALPGSQTGNAPLKLQLDRTAGRAQTLLAHLETATAEKVEGARRARLAYALIMAEEYAPAEEQLLHVLRAAPTYADARAYLGIVYWRTGRTERAQTTLQAALAQAPSNRLARQALAELILDRLPAWQSQGEPADRYKPEVEQARALLEGLAAEKPDDPTLQMALARFYVVARHDYQRAQDFYRAALALNKKNPVAGLNPAAVLSRFYSETSFDPCVRGVDSGLEATRDLPGDPESWYASGLAYSQCGHPGLAIRPLEQALELRPNWPAALYRLALAYDATGRSREADSLFQLLADLEPEMVYHRQAGR